jgi:hypothetical protein
MSGRGVLLGEASADKASDYDHVALQPQSTPASSLLSRPFARDPGPFNSSDPPFLHKLMASTPILIEMRKPLDQGPTASRSIPGNISHALSPSARSLGFRRYSSQDCSTLSAPNFNSSRCIDITGCDLYHGGAGGCFSSRRWSPISAFLSTFDKFASSWLWASAWEHTTRLFRVMTVGNSVNFT